MTEGVSMQEMKDHFKIEYTPKAKEIIEHINFRLKTQPSVYAYDSNFRVLNGMVAYRFAVSVADSPLDVEQIKYAFTEKGWTVDYEYGPSNNYFYTKRDAMECAVKMLQFADKF